MIARSVGLRPTEKGIRVTLLTQLKGRVAL